MSHLSDLEMTMLCAQAMGIEFVIERTAKTGSSSLALKPYGHYDPLHDDAQAMALVKKFHLNILIFDKLDGHNAGWWRVDSQPELNITARNADLNHAIVECVAKMQERK